MKIPGGPVPEWQLFEPQIKKTETGIEETGVITPDGQYFPFDHGESIAFIREGNQRKPVIKLSDGTEVSFEAWKIRRREDLKKLFEGADPKYGELYLRLLEDFPELEQLSVKAGTKEQYPTLEFTGGFWKRPDSQNPNPKIIVEMENQAHYQDLLRDREESAREAAALLGISFEELLKNPEILGKFIFLHEIGHAQDYLANFQNGEKAKNDPNFDPVSENLDKRKEEMVTLPVPGENPVGVKKMYKEGRLTSYFEKYKEYYLSKGITSPEDLVKKHELAYRNLPSEKYADQFAADVLKKYWSILVS